MFFMAGNTRILQWRASEALFISVPAQPYSIVATPLDAQRIQLSWQAPIHTNAVRLEYLQLNIMVISGFSKTV